MTGSSLQGMAVVGEGVQGVEGGGGKYGGQALPALPSRLLTRMCLHLQDSNRAGIG